MEKLRIDVWSDLVCPWCYLGKQRLKTALARFDVTRRGPQPACAPHREEVEVVWRAFELDPSAPAILDDGLSYRERLAKKYGITVERAEQMTERVAQLGAAEGLEYRFDRIRRGNTFNAHRLVRWAAERGAQDALTERLFRAYMTEGEPIGDSETLVRLASEAELDGEQARHVLGTDAYASEVRADEDEARAIGVTGVPFFVLAGRYAMSGAQPTDVLLQALSTAWDALAETSEAAIPEGASCER